MLEHMKAHPTKKHRSRSREVLRMMYEGHYYNIPKKIAEQYREELHDQEAPISADEVFSALDQKYTKAGVLLRGLRIRENMTQVQFAKKINVTQGDLSKMERGERVIGKIIAKRLEALFAVNYRLFLE